MASIYKRGEPGRETYWGRVTRDGDERRASLRTGDRKLAQERLRTWVAKLEADRFGEKIAHTFDEAVVKFIKEHLPNIKPNSADRYVVSIANLKRTLKGADLRNIGSALLNDFVSMRRKDLVPLPPRSKALVNTNRRISDATVRRDLHCLSSIMGMAIEWEWIDVNPVPGFLRRMKRRGMKESPSRTRYLSQAEEKALLANATPYVADGIRFAIDTGLRKEEQFSRNWSHIDIDRNEITIHGSTSKNAKDRRVPMLPRTRALMRTLKKSDKTDAVFWHNSRGGVVKTRRVVRKAPRRFLTMDRGLKAAARRAGIPDLRWHDLRRTCGCRLLQDHGLSIEKVSKWLGHQSIAVTERAYAFLNVEHLHKAIEHAPALERPVIEGEVMEIDDGRPRIS